MKILIPARQKSPSTKLYVKIVAENENQLGIRPVVFVLPGGPGGDHASYERYSCLIDAAYFSDQNKYHKYLL